MNFGTSLTRNQELIIAVKRFKLSVHAQLLIFYLIVFEKGNDQDGENDLSFFKEN